MNPVPDIYHPKKGNKTPVTQKQEFFKRADWREEKKFRAAPAFSLSRIGKAIKVILIAFVLLVLGYGGYLFASKNESFNAAKTVYDNLKLVGKSLVGLNTDAVPGLLKNVDSNLAGLQLKAKPLDLAPGLNNIPEAIAQIQNISSTLGAINSNVAKLKSDGFAMLFNDGEKFVGILRDSIGSLSKLELSINDLRNKATAFNIVPKSADQEYISFTTDLKRSIETLQAAVDMLDRQGENHFLVLFENPTEIRPSGGFVGSYGDLVIQAGQIRSIEANDIYYPEHFSTSKIIPPAQLQGITTKWGPQDANWFFDFRTSAKKTMDFVEASSAYVDRAIKFDGVIALNVRMIEDLLKITGAIDIPEYKLTLTSENFLPEIQKEVESGPDKKPGQNPKRVLKYITPVLLRKLGALSDKDKRDLLTMLSTRFLRKDIQLYFRDPVLESLVTKYGGAGDVYELPADFQGDYLAIVNANIAGGKSDKFISQKVDLKSQIDPLGVITNTLVITRTHTGQNEADWWYRSANQNYMKIFVPPNSRLQDLKGISTKTVYPSVDYEKSGYKTDPDLDIIEKTKETLAGFSASSYKEDGKNVFGFWLNIPAGKTGTASVVYGNSKRVILAPGSKYQFILDKQSGVESDFTYTLEAPTGFKWQESKSPTFNYVNSKLPSRIIINLTLAKDES